MNNNLGISVLIISVENSNIRTEEIYFVNNKNENKGSLSLQKDKKFLNSVLQIKSLFFRSFNITASQTKIKNELSKFRTINPKLDKVFYLCDRDYKSISDTQIQKQIKNIDKELKKQNIFTKESQYLEYEKLGDNFETFLKLHHLKNQLPKPYVKTDKDIYIKVMGKNGKNFNQLIKNIKTKHKCLNFLQLFTKHQSNYE